MNKIHLHRMPTQPLLPKQTAPVKTEGKKTFQAHLQQATVNTGSLKVTKHANERLLERNINISESQWALIGSKIDEAKAKGVKESLVLTDEAALIISAKNKAVITAMDRQEAKEQLFTNIDGTIVLF